MNHAADALPSTVLYIGGLFASQQPSQVRTVLGPCIAACVFDPATGIGGMNHFMLPTGVRDSELPARYGVRAMELLITQIMKLGGDRKRLQAKVFGGAHVLQLASRSRVHSRDVTPESVLLQAASSQW